MTFNLQIKGIKELSRKLDGLQRKEIFKEAVKLEADNIVGDVSVYPPQPSDTTYKRTRRLYDNWKVDAGVYATKISNPTSYAKFVQDDKQQTRIHKRTGWKRLKETAQKHIPDLEKRLKQVVDRLLR